MIITVRTIKNKGEYQKLYIYVQDESEIHESQTEVQPGGGISNVRHWVKYGF